MGILGWQWPLLRVATKRETTIIINALVMLLSTGIAATESVHPNLQYSETCFETIAMRDHV